MFQDLIVDVAAESACFQASVISVLRVSALFNIEVMAARTQFGDVSALRSAGQRQILLLTELTFYSVVEFHLRLFREPVMPLGGETCTIVPRDCWYVHESGMCSSTIFNDGVPRVIPRQVKIFLFLECMVQQ